MKKYFGFVLIAAVVCGFSLAVTSCKDDENDNSGQNGTEQPTDAMDEEGAMAAWRLLCALTDADSLASDWQSQQYDPTVGVSTTNQQFVRLVQVNNLADAKMHFGSMTDLTPSEIGQTATVSVDGMGTLTWKQSAEGEQNIASVDVKLKQIPHLQRIVYCTTDQMGDNAAKFGTAYYRLGDVVVDGDGYYWVCVRPALSGLKDKSYWMNIINAAESGRDTETGKLPGYPKKNLYDYSNRYHSNTIHLPTGLAYEHRQIYELNNFIWALLSPSKYRDTVGVNGVGLGGFDYKYHGEKFLQNVSENWDKLGIWEKLFNRTHLEMLRYTGDGGKMCFFYNGKNWKVGSTARLWMYVSRDYEPVYDRKQSQDEVLYEMKADKSGFDILRAAQDPNAASIDDCPQPNADVLKGVWVIRMKTGSELSTISYSPTNDMGVRAVYRYNALTVPATATGSALQTEDDIKGLDAGKTPFFGEPYYHTSDILVDDRGHHWIVTYPSGMDYDRSPYSELVSLNALEFSEDGAYATNAPKLKEMLRGYSFLWHLMQNVYAGTWTKKIISDDDSNTYFTYLRNMMKENYDIRLLFQILVQEQNARNFTHLCSLPYREDGDTKQRLMRFMMTSDQGKNDFIFNYWQHYPAVPSDAAKYQTNFGPLAIYLQDVANQGMVDSYAKDYYAKRPLNDFEHDGKVAREYRTKADATALKFSNYVYNYQKWFNATYPTDMWNEPVIPVVFDAVLDRGKDNHEIVSVKGRTLTRWQPVPYGNNINGAIDFDLLKNLWFTGLTIFNGTIRIDGKTVELPTYTEVWYNNKNLK